MSAVTIPRQACGRGGGGRGRGAGGAACTARPVQARRRGRARAGGLGRGFLRETPSGKWAGVLRYRDACGQWRQVTKTFTRDRAESERMLAGWVARVAPGGALPAAQAGSPTVEEAVRAALAAQLARGRIERSTHDAQLAACERHLFGELGGVPAASLTPAAAQAWADALCLRVSPGTARVPFSALSKAMAALERSGAVGRSPMARVEPPARPRPSRTCLAPGARGALLGAAAASWGAGDPRSLAVALALMAGLRAGECCGLRWRDVWEGYSGLDVRSSVGRAAGGCYLKGPKCAASERSFPVVPALSRALAARASALGGRPDPSWFCCGEGASFRDPRSLSRDFARLCGEAGVADTDGRRATFHCLRRTFATEAVRAGVDVRTLADLMGHSRADVTLNVYAASGEDAKGAAVARLAAALEPRG